MPPLSHSNHHTSLYSSPHLMFCMRTPPPSMTLPHHLNDLAVVHARQHNSATGAQGRLHHQGTGKKAGSCGVEEHTVYMPNSTTEHKVPRGGCITEPEGEGASSLGAKGVEVEKRGCAFTCAK
eukprot:1160373-Pelagomonas_calceolata.AAC.4